MKALWNLVSLNKSADYINLLVTKKEMSAVNGHFSTGLHGGNRDFRTFETYEFIEKDVTNKKSGKNVPPTSSLYRHTRFLI